MAESEVKMSEGQITKEALEEWKKRIGVSLRIGNIFNDMASRDNIRKFANGIGDPNPLYRDPEYARKTRYGGLIAPPSFLYSIYPTWVLQGLPGVHAFHSGNDWEFYRPIRENDVITPEDIFTGFEEKPSKFAGNMVMEYQEARFTNQRGELIGKAGVWLVRTERQAARQSGKYHHIQLPHPWTEEELQKVDEDCLAEEVRGSTPRYWEDVGVGDELKPVVKGPLGLTDIIAFCVGSAPIEIKAHGMSLRLYRAHPAWAFRDPNTGAWEPVYGVHYNKAAANFAGLPYAYDVGVQRNCWLLHLLTNWIGDDGWIKRCYAEYRKFVYLSDAVYVKGKVTKKYFDENGEACVDVETSAINQRGEDTMPGHATLILPSREKGTWPVALRLEG
ncbi:MAG: MaoC family dehydratase N-terminal domain-containing protein [Dehalococcoidia bacterium]